MYRITIAIAAMPATGRSEAGQAYSLMVRAKIPGGKLTSEQLLAQLDLCDTIGDATLRITIGKTFSSTGFSAATSSS